MTRRAEKGSSFELTPSRSMLELGPRRTGQVAPRKSMQDLTPRTTVQEKPRTATLQEIEENLRQSLASTDEGLKKFLASLQQAKLPEAVQGYRAMQMVLIQQRLWAEQHGGDHLAPAFRSIAETAGEIHRIFALFADVMRPLKELDGLRSVEIPGTQAAAVPDDAANQG